MNSRAACLTLLVTLMTVTLRSADEAPKSRMKDVLKARIAEDAKKAEVKKPASTSNQPASNQPKQANDQAAAEKPENEGPVTAKTEDTPKRKNAVAAEKPTVLPKVEVRKSRITELDQKLAKQEQDIARERKNLKASEVDSALNDAKIARPLSILGGESTQFRQHVASERVELMEAEKDLIEAIAHAKTKTEKQELQKQLDELKAVRRELEKSLR
jgi:hypothetical protein